MNLSIQFDFDLFIFKIGEIFMKQVFIHYDPMKTNNDQFHKNHFILNDPYLLHNLLLVKSFFNYLFNFSSIDGRPDSPISEPEITTNSNKSKWEIRLPELLNSTVGPDRQVNQYTYIIHLFSFNNSFLET
jgi:hypothetical protein